MQQLSPKLFPAKSNIPLKNTWRKGLVGLDSLEALKNLDLPASIYLFKVNNENTRTMCEICSNLFVKTVKRRHWR